ncbi:MAG TPA: RES domain-containing protein [Acidimicrobiales bacterium]|nr:RES domain-containing protein [Acidimicrobiales bacterium]
MRPPARLVRVSRRANTTWWFSSDGSGRFDLHPPEGTCYLATDAYAALREASRGGPVTPEWASHREMRIVAPPDARARLAATTRARAAEFGITTELVTILPYGLPRRWAAAFRRSGFDGIRHQTRHDPRARPSGVSLFGAAGDPGWPSGRREDLTRDGLKAAGVAVLDIPTNAAVTVIS